MAVKKLCSNRIEIVLHFIFKKIKKVNTISKSIVGNFFLGSDLIINKMCMNIQKIFSPLLLEGNIFIVNKTQIFLNVGV